MVATSSDLEHMPISGEEIELFLRHKGITKVWLANQLGISKQQLNYDLRGAKNPKYTQRIYEILERPMAWLVDERNRWRQEFESGEKLNHHYLEQYRRNRNSELWRSTRALERICEYILYLEAEVEELHAQIADLATL